MTLDMLTPWQIQNNAITEVNDAFEEIDVQ
jgi:hypothetical protein